MLKTNSVHAYLRNKLPASSSSGSGGVVDATNADLSSPALAANSSIYITSAPPGWSGLGGFGGFVFLCSGTGGSTTVGSNVWTPGFPSTTPFSGQFLGFHTDQWNGYGAYLVGPWSFAQSGLYTLTYYVTRGSTYGTGEVDSSYLVVNGSPADLASNDVPTGGWTKKALTFAVKSSDTNKIRVAAQNYSVNTGGSWIGFGGFSLTYIGQPAVPSGYVFALKNRAMSSVPSVDDTGNYTLSNSGVTLTTSTLPDNVTAGSVLNFNGYSYLATNLPSSGSFTRCFWFKNLSALPNVLNCWSSTQCPMWYSNSNFLTVNVNFGSAQTITLKDNTNRGSGSWVHYCFTYDDTTKTGYLYVNSTLVSSSTNSSLSSPSETGANLGLYHVGNTPITGQMFAAVQYNSALTSSQVALEYYCTKS